MRPWYISCYDINTYILISSSITIIANLVKARDVPKGDAEVVFRGKAQEPNLADGELKTIDYRLSWQSVAEHRVRVYFIFLLTPWQLLLWGF